MRLSDLNNREIVIYGLGREGLSTLYFLRKHFGKVEIVLTDDKRWEDLDSGVQKVLTEDPKNIIKLPLKTLEEITHENAVIIKAPGIPNKRVPNELRSKLTSQTQLFLNECLGIVIGVTGTKGKSTTSSLIHEVLLATGKKSVLLGNIGKPPLDYLDDYDSEDTLFVFEMSSHQLSTLTSSPHMAVFLNIYPEHLDYYESMDDYVMAKANITRFQDESDVLIYNSDDPKVREIAELTKAKKIGFGESDFKEISFLEKADSGVLVTINPMNILAAWRVAQIFSVSPESFVQGVKNFKPLEHRLELVGTFHGITFYNDSLATVPEATMWAMNTLGDRVETLLIGGFDRGVDYQQLAERIVHSQVKNLILFPTTGEKIWQLVGAKRKQDQSRFKVFRAEKMNEAVTAAYQSTSPGKIALLSCAASSFNLFKDYRDRGGQFKDWVVKLGKKA